MKYILTIGIILSFSLLSIAQEQTANDKYQFQRVYRNDNENLEERIDDWLKLNFTAVEEGTAMGEYKTNWMKNNSTISYQILIETKKGRYRVTATDFMFTQSEDSGTIPFERSIFKKKLIKNAENHLFELTNALKNAINSNGEDW
ncbi:MAG: hypothetical protein AB8G22_02490 [Saprospiraceae bacterium]